MHLYQATDGTIYGGDRQLRSDGTFDPEVPDRPSSKHRWNGSGWSIPKPYLSWTEFVAEFQRPGNALYDGVFVKIDDADRSRNAQPGTLTSLMATTNLTPTQAKTVACSLVRDHWTNFKLMLLSTELRSPENLAYGIQRLDVLLKTADKPLSAADVNGWNALIDKHGFPSSCKLAA